MTTPKSEEITIADAFRVAKVLKEALAKGQVRWSDKEVVEKVMEALKWNNGVVVIPYPDHG